MLCKAAFLCLGPVHLPIVYEECHYRKKTTGSRILRVIMSKFTKVNRQWPYDRWGPAFTGENTAPLAANEERVRAKILDHSFPKAHAGILIEGLDGDSPWGSAFEFIQALAALSALVSDELQRRTHVGGVQLKKLLHNATAPCRMQWYFNNLRLRHWLPEKMLALLGSGTSVNEAMNHEINTWFRNQPEIYSSTVELQLRVGALGKLQAHNCAMYSPTLRQIRPANVLARGTSTFSFSDQAWRRFCREQRYGWGRTS